MTPSHPPRLGQPLRVTQSQSRLACLLLADAATEPGDGGGLSALGAGLPGGQRQAAIACPGRQQSARRGLALEFQLGPYRLLFDCGLSPAAVARRWPAPECSSSLQALDFAFCSHAHPDHAQGLWALHQARPELPIFVSAATQQLLPLNWPGQSLPSFCQAVPWRSPQALRPDLTLELFPAGHLPGAALMLLTYQPPPPSPRAPQPRPYRVAYAGDCFVSSTGLVEGLPLGQLRGLKPDVLILEGTYGTARHPRRRQQENQLVEQLLGAIAQGQSIIMPVPTLGLAQELLLLLRSHHRCTGQDLDIWVDGPVAEGCDRYLDLLAELPTAAQNFARHQPLFWDDRIRPRVHRLLRPSLLQGQSRPCILLIHEQSSWSPFLRLLGHRWQIWLPQLDARLPTSPEAWEAAAMFCHQSARTRRTLQTLVEAGDVTLAPYLLSDHCDGVGTTQLIHNLRPQHVLFVHGGHPQALAELSQLEELRSRYCLHVPEPGLEITLSVSESFFQPPTPEPRYDGDVQDETGGVTLHLSEAIAQDPRWQTFAETGLLEVRWQGEGLLLRGISPEELRGQARRSRQRLAGDCCQTCFYYRNQYCRNERSPLESVRVLAEGYCPEFQPRG